MAQRGFNSGWTLAAGTRRRSKQGRLARFSARRALFLFVKKHTNNAVPEAPVDEDFSCSYCVRKSHHANLCPHNPHKNTRYTFFVRTSHFEKICWSKGQQNGDRRVEATAAPVKSGEELKLKNWTTKNLWQLFASIKTGI